MGKLIMVSNRLPVKLDADGRVERTAGGLASALEGTAIDKEQVWVGWPGLSAEEIADPEPVRSAMAGQQMVPVFLTQPELDGFYEGYSNSTLWPILHYMVERARFSQEWWETYREVNLKFAKTIIGIAQPGDEIWIHDYQLFLVPKLLRQLKEGLRIGFFLHTPFSSSEMYRTLPNRADILEGLLGADVIGFHTYSYLRHFRSSVLRVLGLESEMEGIRHDGREIRMGVYPIGHNHCGFDRIMNSPEFPAVLNQQRDALSGLRLILNVERLDYTKGLPQKLAAMKRFLENHPEKRDEVLFLLIAVPSRQGVQEYDALTEEVQREVGAINGTFGKVGHAPVQFLHRGFPTSDLAALYASAEVCMVTPLRDGMNLVAKEFIDCQRPEHTIRPGVLILSEFAGASNELAQAIHVNPHDVDEVAAAIDRALEMPDDERLKRIIPMQARVRKQDSVTWARRFIADLDQIPIATPNLVVLDLAPLAERLIGELRNGRRLGLFLDYDGTLRDFVDIPDQAVPDQALIGLIRDLATHPQISVAIVSGRPAAFLEKHLGGLSATLVGEHGYRWLDGGSGEWQLFNPYVNTDWKDSLREHIEQVSLLTPGTHVEEKQSALVWHYRKADPEFGEWRARDLLEDITSMAANLPVTVHHGNKIVEISSLQINKGEAVDFLIQRWDCDIALAAGDDQTDETMMALQPKGTELLTIKVGKGATRATNRTDIPGLRRFLEIIRNSLKS